MTQSDQLRAVIEKKRPVRPSMRTFTEFPEDIICPICQTNDKGECMLIPIVGTSDGRIAEAKPVHTGCIKLNYQEDINVIFQQL